MCRFSGYQFHSINFGTGCENDQKFRITLLVSVQEQHAIVYSLVFGIFCNLIIPKQGIEMQFFQVVEAL